MKFFLIVLVLSFTSQIIAGPGTGHSHGHSHKHKKPPISKDKAKELMNFHLNRLVKSKKIQKTWVTAKLLKIEKRSFGKKLEWFASFVNKKEKKPKNKLYIFLKLNGKFVAANFTGK